MTSRLMVQETGSTVWSSHTGDFPDRDSAMAEGARLFQVGSVQKFQVWELACTYERRIVMAPVEVDSVG